MKQNPIFKEINRLKKNLVLNGIKGVVTSGKIPQTELPTCEKEKLRARLWYIPLIPALQRQRLADL